MIYYRAALRGSQSATWRWKSSPLTSLHDVLGLLKLYHGVPKEHIRVFRSSSTEQMEEMLSRANEGLLSTAVTIDQLWDRHCMRWIEVRRLEVEWGAGGDHDRPDGEKSALDDSGGRGSTTAAILDGRAMSAEMKVQVRAEVYRFVEQQEQAPGLVMVRVGADAGSRVYSQAILHMAEEVGITARLEQLAVHTSADEVHALLVRLNHDQAIHGILVQMPLPAHLSHTMVAATIAPSKDIDGISPHSAGNLLLGLPGFVPSTAAAVMEMLERTRTPLEGKQVVILSRSNVVGKPLALLLLRKDATVLICHSRTANLAALMRQADVLVAAAGQPGMVTAEMVKPGAVIIDVVTNVLSDGGMVGDVDVASVREVAGAITPVPGGVGPLTNVMLLKQCVQAAWQLADEKKEVKTAA